MAARVEVGWPTNWEDELGQQAHVLIHAVSDVGGAIGWMSPPPRAVTDRWLHSVLDAVVAGDAAVCTASLAGELAGMGVWHREEAPYFRHTAWLAKIMAHPRARGLGLGTLVTRTLIDSATAAGIETLQLGVRGNNHLAIELYEHFGFQVWGRLPNVIEVGDERFDDVRMFLDLGRSAHLVLHGGAPCGAGSSPSGRQKRPASRTAEAAQ